MKKITTKLILLMLVIPLLLIFAINKTIDMTAIMVDIPVTSINIEGEKMIFVDVLSENNKVQLNTIITPKEATNKGVTYTVESVGDDEVADVNVTESGLISPKSTGTIRVVATANGGRQDSVQINFYSSAVNNVVKVTESLSVSVGDSTKINVGTDFVVYPSGVSPTVTYTTDSTKIKVDKYTGEIVGLFAGNAAVTVHVEGIKYDASSNKFVDTVYNLDFPVVVTGTSSEQIFSFAGGATSTTENLSIGNKVVLFEYLGYADLGQLQYSVVPSDEEYVKSVDFTYDGETGKMVVALEENAPYKEYVFSISAGGIEIGTLTLNKVAPTIRIAAEKTTYAKSNANIVFGSVIEGLEDGYVVRYESTNSSVFSVNVRDNDCVAKARSEGTSYVKAILYVGGEEIAESEQVLFTVVDPYISLGINEATKTYGLENRFVLGKYNYDDGVVPGSYQLSLKAATASGVASEIDLSKIVWKSSNTSIATVDQNGMVKVLTNGEVTITVESSYNSVLQTSVKSSFVITCRVNGLNVYDYSTLMYANRNGYETVLMDNVMLADGITDSNYRDYLNTVVTTEMTTTADKAYYDDNGKSSDAKVRYCVEFTSNIYGNGYFIDGNNITKSVDKYNYSVFNGPLNLVALSYDNNSSSNAKIKAQDNIVFLVKKNGISINNVELKGCSDSSLIEAGQTNLTKLNNVGTVLEIVGDDVSLMYSRVNNGRTVVRVYGSAHESDASKVTSNMDAYRVEIFISNCILSYAREYILKVGSNQILRNAPVVGGELALPTDAPEKYEHAAPSFVDENNNPYSYDDQKDDYFVDNYLMTDVVLKDSVFYGAGLFCICFDTQFAGLALHGYDYGSYKFSDIGWKNVGGTSYPARIRLQGDVRFYDWKEISKIDSSTIVEGDSTILSTVGLDLNISNLLNKFNNQHPDNKVVYTYEGNDYINGAVVFYGGGKNYSWLDTSEVNSDFNTLDSFEVPLSYFGSRVSLIYYAAGKEDFRFMTYNNESNLNYQNQQNDLTDGSAYSWIIRK